MAGGFPERLAPVHPPVLAHLLADVPAQLVLVERRGRRTLQVGTPAPIHGRIRRSRAQDGGTNDDSDSHRRETHPAASAPDRIGLPVDVRHFFTQRPYHSKPSRGHACERPARSRCQISQDCQQDRFELEATRPHLDHERANLLAITTNTGHSRALHSVRSAYGSTRTSDLVLWPPTFATSPRASAHPTGVGRTWPGQACPCAVGAPNWSVAILTGRRGPVLPRTLVVASPEVGALRSSPAVEGRCCADHQPDRRVGVDVAILTGRGGPVLPNSAASASCPAACCDPHRPWRAGAAVMVHTAPQCSIRGCDPHRPWRAGAASRSSVNSDTTRRCDPHRPWRAGAACCRW